MRWFSLRMVPVVWLVVLVEELQVALTVHVSETLRAD